MAQTSRHQCGRCARQFRGDGRPSEARWIGPTYPFDQLVCPNCQTLAEQQIHIDWLRAMFDAAQRLVGTDNERLSRDIATILQRELDRVHDRAHQCAELDQRIHSRI